MSAISKPLSLTARIERWPYKTPFHISGYHWTDAELVCVEIERDGVVGRGEGAGVYYKDDLPEHCLAEIERVRNDVVGGAGRLDLLELLPAGGARNALDCALWDLEAKQQGHAVWELAGLPAPRPLVTTYTIGIDDPQIMAQRAKDFSGAVALKLKLGGTAEDADRVRAVRDARPDVWLAVDANQGFTRGLLEEMMPVFTQAGVQLIEQPLALDRDADLEGFQSPISIAADESAQTGDDLNKLVNRFNAVNIKLDKCGGLTAGLAMVSDARRLGLGVMVGNMGGTSLAMAPAFLIGQLCDVTDLDGPILLSGDRTPAVEYSEGRIWCGDDVWGGAPFVGGPK